MCRSVDDNIERRHGEHEVDVRERVRALCALTE